MVSSFRIEKLLKSRSFFLILSAIATLGFSSKAIFIKLVYSHQVSVEETMLYRMLMALPFYLLILLLLNLRQPNSQAIAKSEYVKMAVVGIFGYYLASYFDLKALQTISVNLERLVLYLYPSIIFVVSSFSSKHKFSLATLLALLVSYFGVGVTFWSDVELNNDIPLAGLGLVVLSAICFACYILGSEKYVTRVGSIRYTCAAMMGAAVAIFVHYVLQNGWSLPRLSHIALLLIFAIALLSTVLPSFLFALAIKHLGAIEVSIVGMLGPIMTLLMSFFILGELFTFYHLIGLACVLGGSTLLALKS